AWAFARILDVAIPDSNLVRLCEAKDVPHNANYLTLSHCWGGFQPLRLLSANYEAMKKQISWSLLPNTFRDAISFTRKLGERYLWIDSICIIQDSRLDWLRESSVMGRIYQGSSCNLAATSAANSSVGLFTCRDPAFIPPLRLFIPDPSKVLIETLPDENLWGREIASSPLCHRAWVLQERLLAPRTLHFASQQLFWECQELQACEKVPRGFLNTTYKRPNPHMRVIDIASQELAWNAVPAPFFQVWEEIVTAYTSADLTKESDKLIAIGGLASILALKSGVRYTAGLWHHDLLRQLLWRVEKPVHRPQNYRAPSWSWASADGTV
ncbi:heterokaryon incompatibility protein-domain-containing protein, partial [Leptodontidium sp. 2 PMI_412]